MVVITPTHEKISGIANIIHFDIYSNNKLLTCTCRIRSDSTQGRGRPSAKANTGTAQHFPITRTFTPFRPSYSLSKHTHGTPERALNASKEWRRTVQASSDPFCNRARTQGNHVATHALTPLPVHRSIGNLTPSDHPLMSTMTYSGRTAGSMGSMGPAPPRSF